MLLPFTTIRIVRSAHLALLPKRCTAQFDFAVSDRYSYEKIHTASLLRRDGLTSALVTILRPRLKARAWCGDLCWDEPISPSQRCRMHILSHHRWLSVCVSSWPYFKIQTLLMCDRENTAHVQWIRCWLKGSHLIDWMSAFWYRTPCSNE